VGSGLPLRASASHTATPATAPPRALTVRSGKLAPQARAAVESAVTVVSAGSAPVTRTVPTIRPASAAGRTT
jgi:hypothetical protein